MSVELVEFIRNGKLDCLHRGDLAIVDYTGKLLYYAGSPEKRAFIRSSSKPVQAVPVVASGAAEHFQLSDKELSVFCASHNAETLHVETVQGVLKKIGLDESALQCGKHLPLNKDASAALLRSGGEPTSVHSNCSGKHAGMLALAQHMGWDIENYTDLEHPVQQSMLRMMALFADMQPEDVDIAIDGCGAPVFGLPVYNMALAWARLARPDNLPIDIQKAAKRISEAMTAEPFLVAGSGRLCTTLMTTLNGRLIAKSGAEGVYCMAILQDGIGIASKIEDGNGRANGPLVVEALRQVNFLTEADLSALASTYRSTSHNHRGDVVGEARAVYTLQRS